MGPPPIPKNADIMPRMQPIITQAAFPVTCSVLILFYKLYISAS